MRSALVLVTMIAGLSGSDESAPNPWESDYRIPKDIQPLYYNLSLNPNLTKGEFKGDVTVKVNLTASRNWIPIHIKCLNVSKTVVTTEAGKPVKVVEAFGYPKNEFWVIRTEQLQPGIYNIYHEFNGSLTRSLQGFYRSTYYENGTYRSIATTKFEPVDARAAFPCFDEPSLKAKFKIKITRPAAKYSSLSNMNLQDEERSTDAEYITSYFAETFPMSTYLVCFIVSDFKDSGPISVNNMGKSFPLKIYSTPNQVENTLFAKKYAASVTNYFVDYFNIPYPLPKLDLIAIPDFASGAMENWGLITFRETALLFNEKKNSAMNKQTVASVVAHEISHQWFGNLVTMKWWDDLWLNEGFASFMQYKGVSDGIPECKEWQMIDQSIHDQIDTVMEKDAALSSHPIIQPVDNPSQITEIFDSISYNKGHAVLRMLEGFMGDVKFRSGIQKYLKAHIFACASTPDLWSMLKKEMNDSSVDVGSVMDSWTRQMGFPVVNVQRNLDSWILSQSRFLSNPLATFNPADSPYAYRWDIPIHYVANDSPAGMVWLKRDQELIKIPRLTQKSLVKFNHQKIGFFRVNYDFNTWKAFENTLKTNPKSMDRKDRSNLLDDAFHLAAAGRLDYSIPLGMSSYLKTEKKYLPWATGCSVLQEVINSLSSSIVYPSIRQYVRSLVDGLYGTKEGQFSWSVSSKELHINRLLRVKILDLACFAGHQACLEEAGTKFMEWIKRADYEIHPDVRSLIYRYGMKTLGGEKEWDIVWDRYMKEFDVQEKVDYMEALAAVKIPWLLIRYIEYAKNENFIRSQDFFKVLAMISKNPVGNPIVWRFFRNEWPYLVDRFTLYHRNLGTFITTVTSQFSTAVELEEIEFFYKKYPESGAGKFARKSALENVKSNIHWLKTNEETIRVWLINHRRT